MERAEIRRHLISRGWNPKSHELEFRVSRIQERIHRYAPRFKERQQAWLATQPKSRSRPIFTDEELARIAEHFEGANDPVCQSIYAKAAGRASPD